MKIREMRNLGPFMAKVLAEIGVHTDDDLRKIGAVHAYVRLKFLHGRHVTLNALYAMEAALKDCHWRELSMKVKDDLRLRSERMLKRRPKRGR
jgi:DNA transformation protein